MSSEEIEYARHLGHLLGMAFRRLEIAEEMEARGYEMTARGYLTRYREAR